MHPILFHIGSIPVPGYGAALVAAFLIATGLLKKEALRAQLDPERTVDVAVMGLLFGLVGAKLLLILIDLPEYLRNPGELLRTLRSAGVIYGGLIGGALGMAWYIRRKKLPLWDTLDTMAPFAALGVGIGRLGCLMAGCCYGAPYDGPFALIFPDHPECRADAGIPLFPIQPLGVLNGIMLCSILVWLRRRRQFKGQVLLAYMFLYSVTRGLLEFMRGDDNERQLWLGDTISTSQLIAIAGIVISVIWYLKRMKDKPT